MPAQEHSERVPGKNFRALAGRPLYCWTLGALIGSSHISRIVIDTDCDKLAHEVVAHFPDDAKRITVRRALRQAARCALRQAVATPAELRSTG